MWQHGMYAANLVDDLGHAHVHHLAQVVEPTLGLVQRELPGAQLLEDLPPLRLPVQWRRRASRGLLA